MAEASLSSDIKSNAPAQHLQHASDVLRPQYQHRVTEKCTSSTATAHPPKRLPQAHHQHRHTTPWRTRILSTAYPQPNRPERLTAHHMRPHLRSGSKREPRHERQGPCDSDDRTGGKRGAR